MPCKPVILSLCRRPGLIAGLLLAGIPALTLGHGAPRTEHTPAGIIHAVITDQGAIDTLNAVILDAPRPGIMVSYRGDDVLTVLGTEGEAFLRFSRDEVQANTLSPSWQRLSLVRKEPSAKKEPSAQWVQVSGSGSFGWLDPRLAGANAHGTPDPLRWRIPIKEGNNPVTAITGTLTWKPLSPSPGIGQP